MRFKLTLILLFANLLMLLFVWYLEHTPSLSTIGDGGGFVDFSHLEITGKNLDKPRILKFENNRWRIVSPIEWSANFYALSRIRNQLEFLDKETSFEIQDLEKHGQTLADYGLDDPVLTFKYGDGKNMRELKIGKNAPVGDKVYMQDVSTNRIIVADKTLAENLSNDIDLLRGQNIFDIPRFEIASFSIRLPLGDSKIPLRSDLRRIGLVKDGTSWNFETPIAAHADAGEVNAFLDMLENVTVRSFAPSNAVNTGLDVTSLPTAITLQGTNRKQTLFLGNLLQNGSLRYARLDENPTIFMVDASLFKNLGKIQTDLRDKAFLKFDELNIDEIDISTSSSSVKLKKIKAGEWDAIGKNSSGNLETVRADFAIVNSIIARLKAVRAHEFVTDAPGEDVKRFGFDNPSLKISIKQANGSAQTLLLGVAFKGADNELLYASLFGSPAVYGISPNVLSSVPSDILSCKSRILNTLPEKAELQKVTLSQLDGNVLFEISPTEGDWQKSISTLPNADKKYATKILNAVKKFTVQKYLDVTFDDKSVKIAGKDLAWKYRLSAEIAMAGTGGNKTETRNWLFTEREGGRTQYGASLDNKAVFEVSQDLIDGIFAFTLTKNEPAIFKTPAPKPLENAEEKK